MPYADSSRARRLAGNPSEASVSTADLTEIIAYSDRMVDSETGKIAGGWQPTDEYYPLVVAASEFFASARTREMFADKDNVSDNHYQRGLDICMRIVKNANAGTPSPTTVIRSQSYKTAPLNPDGEVYRSTFGGVGSIRHEDEFLSW